MSDRIKLTSPVGTFIFYRGCKLSHAKLVRDAVTTQIMNPNTKARRIFTPAHANDYVKKYCEGSYSETPFTFIRSEESQKRMRRAEITKAEKAFERAQAALNNTTEVSKRTRTSVDTFVEVYANAG